MGHALERLFNPRTIAVIGASRNPASIGGQPIRALLDHGYKGKVFAVNPSYSEVMGLVCYPDILQVPEQVDMALIALRAALVPDTIRQCGRAGVRFAVVFSGGFAEIGQEGAALQSALKAAAAETGVRVVGPNCQGIMNLPGSLWAGFGAPFALERLRTGGVSMVTQSGGFGYAVVNLAEEAGVGFRSVVSTGNGADLDPLDFMEYFIDAPETEIIACYLEGVQDGRRLAELGDWALEANKPIVVWKVGESEAGRRAATSHTATLAAGSALYRTVFRERGFLEVDDVTDLVDLVSAFESKRSPRGASVGIVTISGGAGVLAADHCIQYGLHVPLLSEATRSRLAEVLPAFASCLNPVDVTAQVFNEPDLLANVLDILLADEAIDSLVVLNASTAGSLAARIAQALAGARTRHEKPIFVSWSARVYLAQEAYDTLRSAQIPRYPTPGRCVRALAGLTRFHQARARRRGAMSASGAGIDLPASPLPGVPGEWLTEDRAKRLLSSWGVPVTREALAHSASEAVTHACIIGYPVALKVVSPDIPHKTEVGGVRLGISSDEEAATAYREIITAVRLSVPDARIDGVLVQEMVSGGLEAIVGGLYDPVFGPCILVGLGGIFAEVVGDSALRLVPAVKSELENMIKELRAYPVLSGARGRPPIDTVALVDTLYHVGMLVSKLGKGAELDINPLFLLPRGHGVKAADALIRLGHP